MMQVLPEDQEPSVPNVVIPATLQYLKTTLQLISASSDTVKVIKLHDQLGKISKLVEQVKVMKMDRKKEQQSVVKASLARINIYCVGNAGNFGKVSVFCGKSN